MLGGPQEAVQTLERALFLDENSAQAHFFKGEAHRVLGEARDALKHLRAAFALAPTDVTCAALAEVVAGRAARHAAEGAHAAAAACYDEASRLQPRRLGLHERRAAAHAAAGDFGGAARALAEYWKLFHGDVVAALGRRAEDGHGRGEKGEDEEGAGAPAEEERLHGSLLLLRARALMMLLRDPSTATDHLRAAEVLLGRDDAAVAAAHVLRRERAATAASRAMAHMVAGRWQTAARWADVALALDHENVQALRYSSMCLRRMGRFEEAVDRLDRAFEHARRARADARERRALVQAERQKAALDGGGSEREGEQAVSGEEEEEEDDDGGGEMDGLVTELCEAFTDMSSHCATRGRQAEAVEYARRAARLRPESASLLLAYGDRLTAARREEEAAEAYRAAMRAHGAREADFVGRIGYAHYQRACRMFNEGAHAGAEEQLSLAVHYRPASHFYLARGRVREELGRVAGAHDDYTAAVRVDGRNAEAAAALAALRARVAPPPAERQQSRARGAFRPRGQRRVTAPPARAGTARSHRRRRCACVEPQRSRSRELSPRRPRPRTAAAAPRRREEPSPAAAAGVEHWRAAWLRRGPPASARSASARRVPRPVVREFDFASALPAARRG